MYGFLFSLYLEKQTFGFFYEMLILKISIDSLIKRNFRITVLVCPPWRNKLNGAAQGGENDLLLWWRSVVYITSMKRTVQLGSLLGLYESFPI